VVPNKPKNHHIVGTRFSVAHCLSKKLLNSAWTTNSQHEKKLLFNYNFKARKETHCVNNKAPIAEEFPNHGFLFVYITV